MTELRLAALEDAPALLAIYAPYVEQSTISFEYRAPTLEEFRARMAGVMGRYPWLVCQRDGRLLGYAYASPFADRAAYAWSVELSIYLEQGSRGGGLGGLLYGCLIELLRLQGFYTAFGIVSHPNDHGASFHARLGFTHVGRFRRIGFKHGQWLAVDFFQLPLRPCQGRPQPPKRLEELEEGAVRRLLEQYGR